MIHPTALVDPSAVIGANVGIGACSVIGADVEIGDGTMIGPHVVIEGPTRIGRDNRITQFASLGGDPQDKKWQGDRTELVIGDRNLIREWTILSGYSGVHQFCKVGAHAFIGMGCLVGHDVPPFVMMADEQHGRPRGINSEGLKRRGFDAPRIAAIKRAYRTLYMAGLSLPEAREKLAEQARESADVRAMLEFLDHSERSLAR